MKMKRKFGILLGLALMLGLVMGMSLTVYAETGTYTKLMNDRTVVKFNNHDWYIIADNSTAVNAGTVTLLAADTSFGLSKFHDSSNAYSGSTVKSKLDELTAEGGAFASVKGAIADTDLTDVGVNEAKLYLLSTEEANSLLDNVRKAEFRGEGCHYNEWWLRSPGEDDDDAAYVYGSNGLVDDSGNFVYSAYGVRPALKLDLSSVIFSSESKTFSLPITGVTLNPSTEQKTTVGDKVPFTASIEPTGALKMVKWSVGGTNASAVKLYFDADCTIEVGPAATGELTVYAKGITAGTAIVTATATNGTDDTADDMSANCNVTVHAHSFNYAAGTGENANTITATCSANGCTLPESSAGTCDHVATLTISANGGTYDGTTAYGATITDASSIQGDAKVQYQKKTDGSYETATETAPTDAGDYKASITVGGVTASVEYTIAQADSTANAPTGLTATYGQTLADVFLEGKNPEGNTKGTWAWADSTQSVGNVVTPAATFKANFTPTSSNYKTVENVEVSVTVVRAANPASVMDTAVVIVSGNRGDLKDNVKRNGATGAVSYEISGDAKGCTLNGSVLTSGDETGTVSVNVIIEEDDNYEALHETPITVTITDKLKQIITASDVTAIYGDTDKSVSVNVIEPETGGGEISYAVKEGSESYIGVDASTGTLIIKAVPTDGKAYVTVTAAETGTFAQATIEVTVTVSKANAVAATVTANSRTYDGTEKPLVTVTGEATGGEMQYALGDANGATQPYTTSIPAKTDAGTYYVWYKVKGDESHTDSKAACVTATINKKEISRTVTFKVVNGSWDDGTTNDKSETLKGYEGDELKLSKDQIPAVGNKPGSGYAAGSWDKTPSTSTVIADATTYTYTYAKASDEPTDEPADEPSEEPSEGAAKVTKAPTARKLTYNGKDQKLVVKGTASNGKMYYAVTKNTTAPKASSYKTSIPTGKAAGTYYVWYKVKGDKGYKDSAVKRVKVTIAKKTEEEPFNFNTSFKVTQKDGQVTVTWNKVNGLSKVDAYVAYCGTNYLEKKFTSTTKNTLTIKKIAGKKIDLTKDFKLTLVGYGPDKKTKKSVSLHIAGKDNKKFTNVKSFTLSKASVSVKKGKSTKVSVKTYKLENTKKKELSDAHAAKFRYRSTNPKIAKVAKDGSITGVKEGKCKVFVYTRNGLARKIAVTVTK